MNKTLKISNIILYFGLVLWVVLIIHKIYIGISNDWTYSSYLSMSIASMTTLCFPFYLTAKGFEYYGTSLPVFYKSKELWLLILIGILFIWPMISKMLSDTCYDFCGLEIIPALGIPIIGVILIVIMRVIVRRLKRSSLNKNA